MDDRITELMCWGDLIPIIDSNGRKARTKNISHIGARNVFGDDIDLRTAKVDEESITEEMKFDSFSSELCLFVDQERDKSWIEKTIQQAKNVGITLDPSCCKNRK